MPVVSESCQIIRMTLLISAEGVFLRCESANLLQMKYRDTLDHRLTVSLLYMILPPDKLEEQIRHNLYCTSFDFSLL